MLGANVPESKGGLREKSDWAVGRSTDLRQRPTNPLTPIIPEAQHHAIANGNLIGRAMIAPVGLQLDSGRRTGVNKGVNLQAARVKSVPPRPAARSLGSTLFSEAAWMAIARSLRLSRRELQIVQGVFDDEKEVGIAARLGISPHTVHTHFERLHRKLAVSDRAQILIRVMREFLTLTASPDDALPAICADQSAGRCPWRHGKP